MSDLKISKGVQFVSDCKRYRSYHIVLKDIYFPQVLTEEDVLYINNYIDELFNEIIENPSVFSTKGLRAKHILGILYLESSQFKKYINEKIKNLNTTSMTELQINDIKYSFERCKYWERGYEMDWEFIRTSKIFTADVASRK